MKLVEGESILGSMCKELNLNSGMEIKCSSMGQGSKLRVQSSKWGQGRERWREVGNNGFLLRQGTTADSDGGQVGKDLSLG